MSEVKYGPCYGCGKQVAGELIAGSVYSFGCEACESETEANWRSFIDRIADWAESDDCCPDHGIHCEPPSELCCEECTEAQHPQHPAGVVCVLDARGGGS
jgi:hypothetical protein